MTLNQRITTVDYMAMKKCKHGLFLYNTHDTFVGRSLDLYGEWCEQELGLILPLISPGALVLDVGANIGTHTIPFAKKAGPSGLVIAFEPQRLAFQNLCANVSLNALANVNCKKAGVSSKDGWMKIPIYNPAMDFNFAAIKMHESDHGEAVPIVAIDDLGLRHCDLIKIDVEGMEPEVLAGAAKTIQALHPVLFVENNTLDGSRTIKAVEALGYVAYWHIASYGNKGNFFGNPKNVFAQYQPEANMLCFHQNECPDLELLKVLGPDDDWLKAQERLELQIARQ